MLAALVVVASALTTGAVLFLSPAPWHAQAAAVLGSSVVVLAAVAVVAIVVENSRLGYALAVATLAIEIVVTIRRPIDPWWWVLVVLMAGVAVLLSDPGLGGWVRGRASSAPVPILALVLAVLLLTAPALTALPNSGDHPGTLVALTVAAWGLLLAYVRRFPAALAVLRIGTLGLLAGASALSSPGRWVWLCLMLAAAILSWTASVRLAVRPLIEKGTRLMIPPELAPEEIRRAIEK